MDHQENHEMELNKIHESGAEEWQCTVCSRRFLLEWSPYQKIVLELGDEYAVHTGTKGEMSLGSPTITVQQNEDQIISDELNEAIEKTILDLGLDDWFSPD